MFLRLVTVVGWSCEGHDNPNPELRTRECNHCALPVTKRTNLISGNYLSLHLRAVKKLCSSALISFKFCLALFHLRWDTNGGSPVNCRKWCGASYHRWYHHD